MTLAVLFLSATLLGPSLPEERCWFRVTPERRGEWVCIIRP